MESYFSAGLGTPVKVIPLPPNRIGPELAFGSLDFALVNPLTAVEAMETGIAHPVATLKAHGTSYFAGVIMTRRDSGIASLSDLKGKNILAHQKSSAGAYAFQLYHLLKNGIDPFKELMSLRQNDRQDAIVLAVMEGRIDAGFVRSGVIESLAAKGKIKLEDVVVIDERHDDLKLRHTTELYPEHFLVASGKMDRQLIDRLERTAWSLRPNNPAAQAAGIDGFVKPISLAKMKEAMLALRLPPYACRPASAAATCSESPRATPQKKSMAE